MFSLAAMDVAGAFVAEAFAVVAVAASQEPVTVAVAVSEELAVAEGLLWQFLESETSLRQSEATAWEFPDDLGYAHLGIMNSLGFNHSAC